MYNVHTKLYYICAYSIFETYATVVYDRKQKDNNHTRMTAHIHTWGLCNPSTYQHAVDRTTAATLPNGGKARNYFGDVSQMVDHVGLPVKHTYLDRPSVGM